MDWLSPENLLAALGVLATFGVLWYERLVPGQKRIGYRVQMDTRIDDASAAVHNGHRLHLLRGADTSRTSLVLLRIENDGFRTVTENDYITTRDGEHAGLSATFPGRTVIDVDVTEPSHETLRRHFEPSPTNPGLRSYQDRIDIPKVALNRGEHFKLLVVLTDDGGSGSSDGSGDGAETPTVKPRVSGRISEGRVRENQKNPRPSNRVLGLVIGLVLLLVFEPIVIRIWGDDAPPPRGCAEGALAVVGSTAFAPVMRDLAAAYEDECPGASITVDAQGSGAGIRELQQAGEEAKGRFPARLALSDGPKPDGHPRLKDHRTALSVFAVVVNDGVAARTLDLTRADLRRVYTGEIDNWRRLGGPDLPVRLVSRTAGSGTRSVFQGRVLDRLEPAYSSRDCRTKDSPEARVIRCEVDSTDQVLRTVRKVPGAIGYAEWRSASRADGLRLARLDGHRPSLDTVRTGDYPFWEPEHAYTYGAPPTSSLTSKFLDYMNGDSGRNLMEKHGHLPCAPPENRAVCEGV
ncbi:PstS family phosphate ABC transporter substrate-binding protein [Streptomyces boncukensis]|uniref:Solute-binding protein n=1 Tax=Streptomyces boncukensis TaxID=2711219 RepID=A0A6G4X6A3_9ACTN|nr:substrate-binding domain-containing protein [Streptomyces boncukensis]NGO72928.1 solute-binding protein [Streptomyces boncukensis]